MKHFLSLFFLPSLTTEVVKIVIVFFLFTSLSIAQGNIELTIVDSISGKRLENAIVTYNLNNYISNELGRVSLVFVEGKRDYSCSLLGYKAIRFCFSDVDFSSKEAIIKMLPEILQFTDIVVTSTRGKENETPLTFTNLSREQLEQAPVQKDLPYILSKMPSTNFYSENGNGIGYGYLRIRGFDQRRISVLINGVPQNDPEDHSVYWINIADLASSLEDIQVQRGAGVANYGTPSIGGSINLETKLMSNTPSLSFETGYGSFNTKRLSIAGSSGLVKDHLNFEFRGTRLESSGFRDNSWSKFWKLYLGAEYLDNDQSLKLTFFGGPQEDALAFYGIPKTYNESDNLRKTNFGSRLSDREYLHQPQISLIHNIKFNNYFSLKNTLFFISGTGFFDFDGTFGTADYFRIDTSYKIPLDLVMRAAVDNKQFGWISEFSLAKENWKLIFGSELRIHRSDHWGRIEYTQNLPSIFVGETANKRFYSYSGAKDIYSVFGSGNVHLTDKILLSGRVQFLYQKYGIHNEKYLQTDFTTPFFFVNPQIGLNYNFNNTMSGYFSIANTQREPPLKNLYDAESGSWGVVPQFEKNESGGYNFLKPLVRPENLLDFELGFRLNASYFKFNANVYWMEFVNEIIASGGLDIFGQPRVGNAEKTRHLGLELEGVAMLSTQFSISANINFSRNRFVNFNEYTTDILQPIESRNGNYIANAPEFLGNIGLSYNSEYLHIALLASIVGTQYTSNSSNPERENISEETVDAYTMLNFSISLKLPVSKYDVYFALEVNNLLDGKYLLTGFGKDNYFPAAGRNLFGSLKFKL